MPKELYPHLFFLLGLTLATNCNQRKPADQTDYSLPVSNRKKVLQYQIYTNKGNKQVTSSLYLLALQRMGLLWDTLRTLKTAMQYEQISIYKFCLSLQENKSKKQFDIIEDSAIRPKGKHINSSIIFAAISGRPLFSCFSQGLFSELTFLHFLQQYFQYDQRKSAKIYINGFDNHFTYDRGYVQRLIPHFKGFYNSQFYITNDPQVFESQICIKKYLISFLNKLNKFLTASNFYSILGGIIQIIWNKNFVQNIKLNNKKVE